MKLALLPTGEAVWPAGAATLLAVDSTYVVTKAPRSRILAS